MSSSLSSPPENSTPAITSYLSFLLEPSPVLINQLVPAVQAHGVPSTYNSLVDVCASIVNVWSYSDKALLLSGHPAIGETKNLSSSSSLEQGQTSGATPQIVLDRLAHLNFLYEQQFPDLRFVIFVNGRTRQEIVTLLESHLGIENTPVPLTEESRNLVTSPRLPPRVIEVNSDEWRTEVDRGLDDIWSIARDRLKKQNIP